MLCRCKSYLESAGLFSSDQNSEEKCREPFRPSFTSPWRPEWDGDPKLNALKDKAEHIMRVTAWDLRSRPFNVFRVEETDFRLLTLLVDEDSRTR